FQDACLSRIDYVCCPAVAGNNAARSFDGWKRRLRMKSSMVIHVDDGEGGSKRRRCVKKFLVGRVIDVVQARSGLYRIGYCSAVANIEAHNVISTRYEEKPSPSVQCQPLQLGAASIPRGDEFMRADVDRRRFSRFLDVCVKESALVIDRVALG